LLGRLARLGPFLAGQIRVSLKQVKLAHFAAPSFYLSHVNNDFETKIELKEYEEKIQV